MDDDRKEGRFHYLSDTSEPTHIEIERNFRKKTEDNGTFTFTETKEGGKTYRGLKKVAGEGNVYRSEDGSVTITVSTSTLSTDEIKVALESKGIRSQGQSGRHRQL